jgi:multiple antibiotic resistance protein
MSVVLGSAPWARPSRWSGGAARQIRGGLVMDEFRQVLGEVIFGFGTLFAIINPYGLAFVFLDRTMSLSEEQRAEVARSVALNAFAVLVVSLFAGAAILRFFGISLPALRIAGGLVVAVAGWNMLNATEEEASGHAASTADITVVRRQVFFPMTIPLTTGPGTIAAAIALGANRQEAMRGLVLSSAVSLVVAIAITVTIWDAYRRASVMAKLFGAQGTRTVTRLTAFLLLCVGVEIMLIGAGDAIRSVLSQRH